MGTWGDEGTQWVREEVEETQWEHDERGLGDNMRSGVTQWEHGEMRGPSGYVKKAMRPSGNMRRLGHPAEHEERRGPSGYVRRGGHPEGM